MTRNLFPPELPRFASTRSDALQRLQEFVPLTGRYSRDRNHLIPGYPNVSRLSPAIRHRLITEEECCSAPLKRYAPSTIEKFTQEVYWRRYWKAWLSLRPQVWRDYLDELHHLRHDPRYEKQRERAVECQSGRGPVALMNYFARELVETGYLHNHARMWFAGWWIHVERLPWQLGAHFFFQHLLDADPASNTLSWRWVAGLQTPGKTYLPRRSNIEKYVDPELLEPLREGLEHLAHPKALLPGIREKDPITQATLPPSKRAAPSDVGLWIHEEDLLPEDSPLSSIKPKSALVGGHSETWETFGLSGPRTQWLISALEDVRTRTSHYFEISTEIATTGHHASTLTAWAKRKKLHQIAALRPEVGPLADLIPTLRQELADHGVELILLDRPMDREARSLATGGFFSFWKKCQRTFSQLRTGNNQEKPN